MDLVIFFSGLFIGGVIMFFIFRNNKKLTNNAYQKLNNDNIKLLNKIIVLKSKMRK